MRLLLSLAVLAIFLGFSATISKNEPAAAATGASEIKVFFSADTFDAEGYVDSIWKPRILPYVEKRAVDIATLRAALAADERAAGEKYGYRAVAEHNPYNFAVKGRVKILSANVQSRNGRLEADAFPYDGEADVTILVGPIYKGTAIRDLLDFVTFDDFKNQVEFAKLAAQLNLHAHNTAILPAGLPGDGAVGKEFELVGATTQEPGRTRLTVTPVTLEPIGE